MSFLRPPTKPRGFRTRRPERPQPLESGSSEGAHPIPKKRTEKDRIFQKKKKNTLRRSQLSKYSTDYMPILRGHLSI